MTFNSNQLAFIWFMSGLVSGVSVAQIGMTVITMMTSRRRDKTEAVTPKLRYTLEPVNPPRELAAEELEVEMCVTITDTDRNRDTLFVSEVSETSITFKSAFLSPKKQYCVTLTRERGLLRDAKGRMVTVFGKPKAGQ